MQLMSISTCESGGDVDTVIYVLQCTSPIGNAGGSDVTAGSCLCYVSDDDKSGSCGPDGANGVLSRVYLTAKPGRWCVSLMPNT